MGQEIFLKFVKKSGKRREKMEYPSIWLISAHVYDTVELPMYITSDVSQLHVFIYQYLFCVKPRLQGQFCTILDCDGKGYGTYDIRNR